MLSLSSPSGTLGNLTVPHPAISDASLRTKTPSNSLQPVQPVQPVEAVHSAHSVQSVQSVQLASRSRRQQAGRPGQAGVARSSSSRSSALSEDPRYARAEGGDMDRGAGGDMGRAEGVDMYRGSSTTTVPEELSSLASLVGRLESAGEDTEMEVTELKRAVVGLADDVKKQISAARVAPSTRAKATQLPNGPGRNRLSPSAVGEAFRAESGLSDLEGVFPRPHSAMGFLENSAGEGRAAEPSIPRSEVIALRSRLNKKLSESNTYNRFLLREIQYREDAIRDTKAVLVALLLDLKDVSSSIAELWSVQSFIPMSSIGPNCMPSLVNIKLEGLLEDLEKQLQGVEAMKLRDVPLVWFGMAEDVKVMGSFDGWTYGEQMSPESTGTMTRFATTLKLRPGRYEIKFMVDGEWRVAPEWPTSGHGMIENNVLVVD